jgi:hypothetical protein
MASQCAWWLIRAHTSKPARWAGAACAVVLTAIPVTTTAVARDTAAMRRAMRIDPPFWNEGWSCRSVSMLIDPIKRK